MRFHILWAGFFGLVAAAFSPGINLKPARRHDAVNKRSNEIFLTDDVELTYAEGMLATFFQIKKFLILPILTYIWTPGPISVEKHSSLTLVFRQIIYSYCLKISITCYNSSNVVGRK